MMKEQPTDTFELNYTHCSINMEPITEYHIEPIAFMLTPDPMIYNGREIPHIEIGYVD